MRPKPEYGTPTLCPRAGRGTFSAWALPVHCVSRPGTQKLWEGRAHVCVVILVLLLPSTVLRHIVSNAMAMTVGGRSGWQEWLGTSCRRGIGR